MIDIASVPIKVQALDGARAAAMEFLDESPPSSGLPRLSLFFGDELSATPRGTPDESYGNFKIWRTRRRLHACYGDDVVATASKRSITVAVRRPELLPAFNYFFPLTIAHSLAFHKRLVLRGGGLYRSNRAILVLGEQGSGKSTTVLAGLMARWGGVSDDSIVIWRRNGTVRVGGIIKEFLVPGDVLPDPLKQTHAIPKNDSRQRWRLPNPGWGHASYELVGAVVVHQGHVDDSELQILPKNGLRDAVLSALPASMSLKSQKSAAWRVMGLVSAISDLPAWNLMLSRDPSRRLVEASRMLEEIASLVGAARSS